MKEWIRTWIREDYHYFQDRLHGWKSYTDYLEDNLVRRTWALYCALALCGVAGIVGFVLGGR